MGDFSANFNRPETGVHTVEGNVAGPRAAMLTKKREQQQKSFEEQRKKIVDDASRHKQKIADKFDADSNVSAVELAFRKRTAGLCNAEDFRKAAEESRDPLARRKRRMEGHDSSKGVGDEKGVDDDELERKKRRAQKKKMKKKKKMLCSLSFADTEDMDGIFEDNNDEINASSIDNGSSPLKVEVGVKKDPNVDTSFLPDKERESRIKAERKRLKKEWREQQAKIKNQLLEITYSYWDGSGHRRTVTCKKGDTIAIFLENVRKDLSQEFREMSNVSSDALIYVKEDLMIPQDITFYDLIVTKARGKSGPLFDFSVRDDVRVEAVDVRVERDDSHPGKVVERRWYERNKHIFPASRWETFDPGRDYGKYTIHGGEVNVKK